jgi:hypothetical protein
MIHLYRLPIHLYRVTIFVYRVPHLRRGLIAPKVGNRAKRDPFSSIGLRCFHYEKAISQQLTNAGSEMKAGQPGETSRLLRYLCGQS